MNGGTKDYIVDGGHVSKCGRIKSQDVKEQ